MFGLYLLLRGRFNTSNDRLTHDNEVMAEKAKLAMRSGSLAVFNGSAKQLCTPPANQIAQSWILALKFGVDPSGVLRATPTLTTLPHRQREPQNFPSRPLSVPMKLAGRQWHQSRTIWTCRVWTPPIRLPSCQWQFCLDDPS